jgi:hypothetical protein
LAGEGRCWRAPGFLAPARAVAFLDKACNPLRRCTHAAPDLAGSVVTHEIVEIESWN